jgi:catechol 2,3-dioxygenase-like lactoylglutathione lyase family enzyme
MYHKINGVQHLGVGVKDHEASWKWLRKYFKMDIPFFNAVAEAPLMDVYTKGKTINKRAAMIMNLKGGCAMEVVSPVSFTARPADFELNLGDIGIFVATMRSENIEASKQLFDKDAIKTSSITTTPDGLKTFFVQDINGLNYQVIEGGEWYSKMSFPSGGVTSCIIGVSDMEKSLHFYQNLMGFDVVVYDKSEVFQDFNSFLPNGNGKFRRVKLQQKKPILGGFALLGGTQCIELVQSIDEYQPKKIWKGRIWGDVGFVHLGMDVRGMKAIGEKLSAAGHPFTCDTKDILSMGDSTKVHCTYIDDPDGILLEMIEVFKIPLIEKLGIYLNVAEKDPTKPLPNWLLKLMRFMRVKD